MNGDEKVGVLKKIDDVFDRVHLERRNKMTYVERLQIDHRPPASDLLLDQEEVRDNA